MMTLLSYGVGILAQYECRHREYCYVMYHMPEVTNDTTTRKSVAT